MILRCQGAEINETLEIKFSDFCDSKFIMANSALFSDFCFCMMLLNN